MAILYLIRGVPGSGKSSLAQDMVSTGMAYDFTEADDFMYVDGQYVFDANKLHYAHQQCKAYVETCLKHGESIIVSNTSTTEKEVEVYETLARVCGAKFVSIVVENRHGGENIHNVPAEKIQQMKSRFSVKL